MGGTGLGLAMGFEQGAKNFLDTYFAVKRSKEDSKFKKLAPVMQTIFAQIQDPNTPLDSKIMAMNSLEPLLGIKSDIPLASRLGLDKLAESGLEIGEEKIPAKAAQLVEDPSAVEFNKQNPDTPLATSINQKATPATPKKLLQRRGDLSEADIETIKKKQLISAQRAEEFEYQYKLAQVNANLQERVMNKQGWKNNGDWTYDENTKSWQQEWFNPITKETYQQKLQPGVVPEAVILKQIQAGGKSGSSGVSLAYKTLRQSIATTMGKEIDDPEVELQTAKIWKNNFALGVINKQQDVEGTSPITKNQTFNNNMQILAAQQKHGELIAAAQTSRGNVESLATRKGTAWQVSADAKANFDVIKQDYDPEDKEYKDAEVNYRRAFDAASDLETQYQNALKSHNKLQEQVNQSEQNLKKAGVSLTESPEVQQFSPRMRVAIDAVRKANSNTKLTDAQIAERIRREKGIQ